MTTARPVCVLSCHIANTNPRSVLLRSLHACTQNTESGKALFRSPIVNVFHTFARGFKCFSVQRYQASLPKGTSALPSFASPPRRQDSRVIRTLDERRLSPSDFQDISNYAIPFLNVQGDDERYHRVRIRYLTREEKGKGQYRRFPADVRGYIYFHRASDSSASWAHEIRFRKTGSADPESFNTGQDLLLPNGLPWRIPMFSLPSVPAYNGLYRLLIWDGLVSTDDVVEPPTGSMTFRRRPTRITDTRSVLLSHLDQPLSIRYGANTSFWVMINDRKASALGGILVHRPNGTLERYTGSVLCRFERSNLPEHQGTRTLVLRVLDVTEDVKLVDGEEEDVPLPVVGGLLPRLWKRDRRSGDPRPSSCNVDDCNNTLSSLRLLVDAAEGKNE